MTVAVNPFWFQSLDDFYGSKEVNGMNDSEGDAQQSSASLRPTPLNFAAFVPYACYQLQVPFSVRVVLDKQDEYLRVDEKTKKSRKGPVTVVVTTSTTAGDTDEQEVHLSAAEDGDSLEVVLTAVMDNAGHVVELVFNRCIQIPRLLIKVIGLCIPYHPYLHKVTIRWGPLSAVLLYEISKFLSGTYLTEICLDDSPIAGSNYEVLLEQPHNLQFLSLARCRIDDADCAKIAALLAHPLPASKKLHILLLVSNRIGDQGACALANVLRTNRTLECLDLAGNRITDVGAMGILSILMEFPLTVDETFQLRTRHLEYLKIWNEVYAQCFKDLLTDKSQEDIRYMKRKPMRTLKKASMTEGLKDSTSGWPLPQRAHAMAVERIGVFTDPYANDHTTTRDGQLYCIGNTSLCYLNLSYNSLDYPSVAMLYEVLVHQNWLGARAVNGLMRVGIEGNNLPVECDELILIDDLLERAVSNKTDKQKSVKRDTKSKPGRGAR